MITIKAFKGIRPKPDLSSKVASRPYDVLNSEEARIEADGNPYSFLHIIKSEIDLPAETDIYDEKVYLKARENFLDFLKKGVLEKDQQDSLYIYRQQMGTHIQTGLVACSSIEDYFEDRIKKHEFTRPVKENDRIRHMKTLKAHPGPVFLTYHPVRKITELLEDHAASHPANCDFVADDEVRHCLWVINDPATISKISALFAANVEATYIADGHHRAASSAKVGKMLRDENPDHKGTEEYNFFLSVLFPANQLKIIDYNRLVKDLNGLSKEEFMTRVSILFDVQDKGTKPYKPGEPKEFGMYMDGKWYCLRAKSSTWTKDPIGVLDVTVLSNNLLDPILGIKDQRTDNRIDFVGGIRGLEELSRRVDKSDMEVAFALYPVSIQQLIDISDSGQVMPPKSTWFEPKLRSGLVVHEF